MHLEKILESLRSEKRILGRVLTTIESNLEGSEQLLNFLFQFTGNAYRVGITGPPGAGKSTITNQLAKHYRKQGKTVAIIAVDPTSPFTGGALLGDRVRMSDLGGDEGVFIRSMATRGNLGGLTTKARDVADVLDAAGYDIILFETVGVGQSELDIVEAADTVVVVLVPESGDSIQAMKAGLMEIADFFVLNKSDRPGAEQAVTALRTILMMRGHNENSWLPDILSAVSTENKGIPEIAAEINRHYEYLIRHDKFAGNRLMKQRQRVKGIVEEKLIKELWTLHPVEKNGESYSGSDKILSPYLQADDIIAKYKSSF